MAMYKKRLRSVKDLEKEKKRVSKKLDQLKKEEFFPSFNPNEELSLPNLDFLSAVIPEKFSIVSKFLPDIISFAKSAFEKRSQKSDSPDSDNGKSEKKKGPGKVKKVAGSILMEVLTGYLKWKAIELSFKGARYLIKQRQQKRAAAKAETRK